ncbi:MAG: HPP family protein [Gammaproteobacteria bacterium]|nr:HPP family protein [Gammaproteobacteria bacterium]
MQRLLRLFAGDFLDTTNHFDKLVALVGGVIGLYLSLEVAASVLEGGALAGLVLASLGATAVLLFAVPHGALSQPWNVLGGHGVSALVGVSLHLLVPHPLLAAALAVGLAIWAMHYLRCIHPPGGATALFAVLGGAQVEALGYGYVLHPVLSSVAVMTLVAVAVNYPFAWRRYPATLAPPPPATHQAVGKALERGGLSFEDLEFAMRELNLYLDMTEDDMARLYLLARRHHEEADHVAAEDIRVGECYSNGPVGPDWVVRKVIGLGEDDRVVYREIGGAGKPENGGTASREDFARWAHHRVDPTQLRNGR